MMEFVTAKLELPAERMPTVVLAETRVFWIVLGLNALWALVGTGVTFNVVPIALAQGLADRDAAVLLTVFAASMAVTHLPDRLAEGVTGISSGTASPTIAQELVATDGRLEMARFGRISELNDFAPPGARSLAMPEEFVQRYGTFKPDQDFRNHLMTPDFPTAAELARQLYPQSGGAPRRSA